ncbi:MAG: hypothetical protein KDC09_01435 [Bacteroidales bacterium]|nr:hypothetical protein [Bacteroidales bacterium]
MDTFSSTQIIIGIGLFILLIVVLVSLLYKPGKKLEINCEHKELTDLKQNIISVHVKNTGKKRIKIVAPFVSFYSLTGSEIFQVDPKKVHCKFPRILKVGDEVNCEIEIGHYGETLKSKNFHPSNVKIFVKDTVGMKFNSNPFEFHV